MFSGKLIASGVVTLALLLGGLTRVTQQMITGAPVDVTGTAAVALKSTDGLVTAPGLAWASDPGSGWYRIGANDYGYSVNQSKKLELDANSFRVTGSTLPMALDLKGSGAQLGFNVHWDGSQNTYLSTNPASSFEMDTSGNVRLYTAPSGTGGTAATLTERLKVSPSGVTIGAGTAISASYYATTTWDPASIGAGTCTSTTISMTGVAAGAPCVLSIPSEISTPYLVTPVCYATANTCNIQICSFSGTQNMTSQTWGCRVFNP
jgi:hypothetical protein